MSGLLSITVNGEVRRLASGASVAILLTELGLDPVKVAVERNLGIVPKSTYPTTLLCDGDALEVVHFVGGGEGVCGD